MKSISLLKEKPLARLSAWVQAAYALRLDSPPRPCRALLRCHETLRCLAIGCKNAADVQDMYM